MWGLQGHHAASDRAEGCLIRVLICDDQRTVVEGLRAILSTAEQIEVVGVAHDGVEVVWLIGFCFKLK